MATKLFLRNTTTNGIGSTYLDMVTTAGSSSATIAVVNTAASGTEIQWTTTAGGAVRQWISGRAPVGGFTLTTTDISIWAHESGNAANAGGRYRVFHRTTGGTETEIGGGPFDDAVEFTKTTPTEMTWAGNTTDKAFLEDERILVKLYITNVGVMGGSQTCTLTYDNADAATGDSFFNIAETITFKAEAVNVTVSPTGVSSTSSVGTVTVSGSAPVTVTGVSSTASVGSVVIAAGAIATVTGNALTGSVGDVSLTGTANVTPTGVGALTSVGSPTISGDANFSVTGVNSALSVGDVAIGIGLEVPVTGISIASNIGDVGITGTASVAPTGTSGSFNVGDVAIAGEAQTTFTGVEMAMMLGGLAVTGGASTLPGGFGLLMSLGSVVVTTSGGGGPVLPGFSQLNYLDHLRRL